MESANDFNRKQYQIIIDKLNMYENGTLDLSRLIGDLEVLLGHIKDEDNNWRTLFLRQWGRLEDIYSIALVENSPLSKVDEDNIAISINNIRKLVQDALNDYLARPDSFIINSASVIDNDWLMCPYCTNVWENTSQQAMVICPSCNEASNNPRYQK